MIRIATILLVFVALVSMAQRSERESKSKTPRSHQEDLTDLRLRFPEMPDSVIRKGDVPKVVLMPAAQSVHEKVNDVLDSIFVFNKTKMFVDGFTIQIYSGLKKEDAMNVKKKMVEEAVDLNSELKYQQPKWHVKTGSYYTRLEAQRDLHRLKRIFPAAILVPEKVALR